MSMKTKHLILYNGRPYLADGEEPGMKDYRLVIKGREIVSNAAIRRFGQALKDWENSLEQPLNVKSITPELGAISAEGYETIEKSETMWFVAINESWEYFSPPQLVEVEGKRIIRILQ